MEITEKDVEDVSSLANLNFNDETKKNITTQLKKILDYVEKLNELDTTDIKPTSHALPLQNVFKEDLVKKIFDKEISFQNAPQFDKRHYQVPKIIE
ncbi:MAG TPA: Asp-tRNA(Asn)/Glu-tRNA(Gln) amidotransferase subunit GatC [Nitrospinota bacterium]|jgi:aspartyl-tRNA(Asn)/glutamyl-tRNA(Gln) amidotransferase subunit C|nr:Asp-tRNA(Asn)/Glu-tRNA(Gln) amidotransferase subunit GatC [Nitrospinota bacterium]